VGLDDLRKLAEGFHDGDIVDVYWTFKDGRSGVERVDFGGLEGGEIVNYLVRADVTTGGIELDDHITDIRLVVPWTARPASALPTDTIGGGSRPETQSALALNGARFRTKRAMRLLPVRNPVHPTAEPEQMDVSAGTVLTVTLANPDATEFVLTTDGESCSFVVGAKELSDDLAAL
jgi:hypothetical protein